MDPKNLICFSCEHFSPEAFGCKAFPDGIPKEIIEHNKHDKPLKDQKNNLVYKAVKKERE